MNAIPKPRPDPGEPALSPPNLEQTPTAGPATLTDAISIAPDAPPPHLLWATLESAYTAPAPPVQEEEERLPPHVALPMAIGLSLVLWAIIITPVLMR